MLCLGGGNDKNAALVTELRSRDLAAVQSAVAEAYALLVASSGRASEVDEEEVRSQLECKRHDAAPPALRLPAAELGIRSGWCRDGRGTAQQGVLD
jgi:hypothetical protein